MNERRFHSLAALQLKGIIRISRGLLCFLVTSIILTWANNGQGQLAFIDDAWWTYQQDCNGDGCQAGTLAGDKARLNWNPGVTNCNGTLTVFEKVYSKACASNAWTLIYTTPSQTIVGCRSSDAQYLDIAMSNACACRDYKIEVYRTGSPNVPDYIRSSTNDADLSQHREQPLAQDYCQSDNFATCVGISGSCGSHPADNTTATKEPGEPNHAGNAGGKSLWFCWTAPNGAAVTMDTTGSSFDTLLAVYTGSSVSSLSVVTNNDDMAGATNRFSRVTFTPVAGTTYHIAVDGYGGAFGMMMLNWNQACAALPDLIFWGPAASPAITTQTFTSTDCEVVEGCESTGTHTLLTFNAETRNIGSGDLVIGDPSTNVLFHYASCHGHYHFEDFAQYSLLDTNGNTVATGHKVGFCVTDNRRWSPTANQSAVFNCNYQGLQAGWADVYKANLPCQYVDITGVPHGSYVLRMALNPAGLIAESDTNNNATLVPITIGPQPACTPANDNFANAISVTATPFSTSLSTDCATREAGEPNHAGDSGGHSIWYKWTPSVNQTAVITTKGSNFDTLLAVYTGNSVSSLALVANNDDIIFGVYLQSYVSFAANAGTTYRIAVDGYQGAVGRVILNINPAGNDDFANANVISGTSGTTNGFTIAASKEPYEPAHAGDVGGRSVWYTWVAPINGPVEFNTAGSSFDTVLAVYTGNNVTSLTAIAGNDDDVGGVVTSRLGFSAVAGTTYRIAVDGAGGASGNDILNWNMMSRLGIARLPGGQAQVSFTGVNWQRYALESSSNFTTWSTQATRTMSGGSQQYLESSPPGRRFYRTVRMP